MTTLSIRGLLDNISRKKEYTDVQLMNLTLSGIQKRNRLYFILEESRIRINRRYKEEQDLGTLL